MCARPLAVTGQERWSSAQRMGGFAEPSGSRPDRSPARISARLNIPASAPRAAGWHHKRILVPAQADASRLLLWSLPRPVWLGWPE
jgi:hypothetical protein